VIPPQLGAIRLRCAGIRRVETLRRVIPWYR
jgi:hypothetical protein